MLADGGRIAKTQSAVVLEKLIGQFLFDKAASGRQAKMTECVSMDRDRVPTHARCTARVAMLPRRAARLRGRAVADDPFEPMNRAMYAVHEVVDGNDRQADRAGLRRHTCRGSSDGHQQLLQQHRRPVLGHQRRAAGQARQGRQRPRARHDQHRLRLARH